MRSGGVARRSWKEDCAHAPFRDELEAIAEHLLTAEAERREVPSLAKTHGELTLDEGYQVQDRSSPASWRPATG